MFSPGIFLKASADLARSHMKDEIVTYHDNSNGLDTTEFEAGVCIRPSGNDGG